MLNQLVHDRNERLQTIAECRFDIEQIEAKIVKALIQKGRFEMFTVNWRKLNRAIQEAGPEDA